MKKLVSLALVLVMMLTAISMAVSADAVDYGNVDGKDGVTTADALLALQAAVGKITLTDEQKILANVDGDKEGVVSTGDALLILQYAVKKIDKFPVQEQDPDPEPISLPDSLIDTGAYALDETADNSFVLDETSLTRKTIYVLADNAVNMNTDEERLVYSFQGLLNRAFLMDQDHTSLLYVASDKSDSFWLNYCRRNEDGVFKGFETKVMGTMEEFYSIFKELLLQCNMVLWDADVPSTSNVAGTVCGVEGWLPVLAGSELQNTLQEMGLEVKLDLSDKFTGEAGTTIWGTTSESTGSAKNDAYIWALEKYFDKCSSKYMGFILDGSVVVPSNYYSQRTLSYRNSLENMDYLIARHAFLFDLHPNVETVCDDPDQPLGTDHNTMIKILKRRYERANGEIGQLLGFPPWWIKYTTDTPGDTGKNGKLGGPQLEWLFCEYITSYNMAMEADAADPCYMTNGSFYYKYRATSTEFKNSEPPEKMTFDASKRYFTFYVGDYDSSAWLKNYIYEFWSKDATRGKIDLMWAFNPNLCNRVPMVFDYIYQNKTDRDFIAAGEGAGYTMPGSFIVNRETGEFRDYDEGFGRWKAYSKKYYDLFDIDITGFIINVTSGQQEVKGINSEIMSVYNELSPIGSFTNAGNTASQALALYNGTPYVYLFNEVAFNEQPDKYYADMKAYDTGRMRRYNFSAYRTIVQRPGVLKKLAEEYIEYASTPEQEYVYVDPYNFFDLVRQSGQGTEFATE